MANVLFTSWGGKQVLSQQQQMPMRLNETTRAFFARLATISPSDQAYLLTHLDDSKVQEKLRIAYPTYNSMLRTSLVPTIIKGGFRSNVIPGDAEAVIDVRALPDEDIPAMIARLNRLIADPAVTIVPPPSAGRPATPPSTLTSDLFKAIEKTTAEMFPGAVTLPQMLTGATDSAQLRAKGVQAYGLGPLSTSADDRRAHGNDERLSVAGLGRFTEFLYRVVNAVAGE